MLEVNIGGHVVSNPYILYSIEICWFSRGYTRCEVKKYARYYNNALISIVSAFPNSVFCDKHQTKVAACFVFKRLPKI